MSDNSITYARLYVDDRTGQFKLVSVENFPKSSCSVDADEAAPYGLHAPDHAELNSFKEKFGYKPVCKDSNLFVISFHKSEPPEEPGILKKAVDSFLSGLVEGIGLLLGGAKKGSRLAGLL